MTRWRLPEVRAEILRVLLALGSGAPAVRLPEALEIGVPCLTVRDVCALELATEEDLALVNSCLVTEAELRERAFAALERLCAYANMCDGDLDERLRALPLPALADAAECLRELGWATPSENSRA